MNESSRLFPASMRAQSDAAIAALRADNDALETAGKALDAFINDDANRSAAFENLRRKMQDFRAVADALIKANDSDIADHQRLIHLVGSQVLDGSVIIPLLESNLRSRATAEDWIAHYDRVLSSVSLLQRRNPFDRTHRNARRSKQRWVNYLRTVNRIITKLERKVRSYNEIEQATRELLTSGGDLRSAAVRGLEHIQEAAEGLPGSYDSEGLGAWRDGIAKTKAEFARNLFNRFTQFDEHGNLTAESWARIEEALSRPTDEISDLEFAKLAHVFVSLEAIADLERFLNTMTVQIGAGENEFLIVRNLSGSLISNHNIFTLCPDIVGRLQRNIDIAASLVLHVQLEQDDADKYNALNELRHTMIERSVLLGTIHEVAFRESEYAPFRQVLLSVAEDRPISLVAGMLEDGTRDGFDLKFETAQNLQYSTTNRNGLTSIDAALKWGQVHRIQTTSLANATEGAIKIVDATEARLLQQHEFNPINSIISGVASLGMTIATLGASSVVDIGIDIFSSLVGMQGDMAAAQQIQRDIVTFGDNSRRAIYVENQNLDVVVVTSGSSVQAHMFPMSQSEYPLNLDAFLEEHTRMPRLPIGHDGGG